MSNNKNDNNKTDKNEHGLFTNVWANEMWHSLHCITFDYPEKPTEEEKINCKAFFISLKNMLPCCVCKKHYTENIENVGHSTEITDDVFESKQSLTLWLYKFHKHVAEVSGYDYDLSYEDVCQKYNSFVAVCDMDSEYKKKMYKQYYDKEAPILSYEMAICFDKYAKQRGLPNFLNELNKTNQIDRYSDEWIKRNAKYWELLKHMRLNSILGFESDGEYEGLPTVEELQLIQLMSTSLHKKVIRHMIKKIGYSFEPVYNFVKE